MYTNYPEKAIQCIEKEGDLYTIAIEASELLKYLEDELVIITLIGKPNIEKNTILNQIIETETGVHY